MKTLKAKDTLRHKNLKNSKRKTTQHKEAPNRSTADVSPEKTEAKKQCDDIVGAG